MHMIVNIHTGLVLLCKILHRFSALLQIITFIVHALALALVCGMVVLAEVLVAPLLSIVVMNTNAHLI